MQLVPQGVAGELYIGGAGVARGYLNRPELTAERFVANPFHDPDHPGSGERLYRSGDLARWLPGGNLEFLGRNDDQVKLRGYRIELGEIEAQLQRHALVNEAVVVAHADGSDEGTEGTQLIGYITPAVALAEGETLELDPVRGALKAALPEYMVPRVLMVLDRLPLTPNGKVDKRALPAPDGTGLSRTEYVPPQGELEETLAGIWQTLLGVERVGRHDNFFDLGGHSLLAVQLVPRVEQQLSRALSLMALFEAPALCDLAESLRTATDYRHEPIAVADRSKALPLSWPQQRLWFIAQLDPAASRTYHISASVRLRGELSLEALQATLNTLLERHEVLRTTFVQSGEGEPLQVIGTDSVFALQRIDLSALDADEQLAALAAEQTAESETMFDMASGPLIRGRLIALGEHDCVLLVTMHHIVSDGWSSGIFIREIEALYPAYLAGRPNPLPPLRIQYADYACWQRTVLDTDALSAQVDYWQGQLAGAPELLSLPLDRPRPSQQDYLGGSVELTLSPTLTKRLNGLARSRGMTLYMVLLGAWGLLLSRLSTQETVVIGTPVANRPRAELEELIGFFVNTLAIRIDVTAESGGGEGETVAGYLDRVKGQALGAYANQDVPFEQVVEGVQPTRSLSHSALFQAMFAFENVPDDGALDLPNVTLDAVPEADRSGSLGEAREGDRGGDAQFDLTLTLGEVSRGGESLIVGDLRYASALFDRSTIERWSGYLQRLLESLGAASARVAQEPLSSLTMIGEAEREQLLYGFNDTGAPYPQGRCIHELFEAQAARAPEAVALVFGERTLSYGQLNERANRVAHRLIGEGVGPDTLVGLCAERSLEMVIGLMGVLKAGGAYVPIDPSYPEERVAYLLSDSGVSLVLTQGHLQERLPLTDGQRVLWLDAPESWADEPASNPDRVALGLSDSHLAYVIYTSGSTGQPKGAMNQHRVAW